MRHARAGAKQYRGFSLNKKHLKKGALLLIVVAMVSATFMGAYLFALSNVSSTSINFTPGYRSLSLSWDGVSSASFYAIYRADDAMGTNAKRIAVISGDSPNYNDELLRTGGNYSYAVQSGTNRDALASVDFSTLAWTSVQQVPLAGIPTAPGEDPMLSPHKGEDYTAQSKEGCSACHIAHDADNMSLIVSSGQSGYTNQAMALCADCHEHATAPESKFVKSLIPGSSEQGKSGHVTDSLALNDGKLECISCHGPHQDSAEVDNALTPNTVRRFGTLTDDLTVDKAKPNALCGTCHDDAQTWYTAFNSTPYPDSKSPEVAGTSAPAGYALHPTGGGYPGATIANDPSKNAHAKIAPSEGYGQGDCRYCHTSHASQAPYAGLLSERGELRAMVGNTQEEIDAERMSGAYASFCLDCHNENTAGTPWEGAYDIAQHVSLPAGSSEASRTAFLAGVGGHKITSPNASIPQGSQIPCFTCHNAHGSRYNNVMHFNDALVQGLTNEQLKRDVCFTCHVSSDGKVLAKDGSGLVDVDPAEEILGLRRGAEDGNYLKLVTSVAQHESADTHECSSCHGGPHDPVTGGSGSPDGAACISCHADDFPAADAFEFVYDGSKEAEGWEDGYMPHLIPFFSESMGISFRPESILLGLPGAGTPPAADKAGPYCAGCHAWHTTNIDQEDGGTSAGREQGWTVRENYNSFKPANTDFMYNPAAPRLGGLCLSCHNNFLGTATVGAPTTGPINKLNDLDAQKYEMSAHDYGIEIIRKAADENNTSDVDKVFYANCTKCHNSADPIANPLENSDKLETFGHFTPGRRLLSRYGFVADIVNPSINTDPDVANAQNFNNKGMCFGCHARKGEIAEPYGKAYDGKDWYGQQPTASTHVEEWRNSSNQVIGSIARNSEAILDDMYFMSGRMPFNPGNGTDGAVDTSARTSLKNAQERSGHQPTHEFDANRTSVVTGNYVLRQYVRENINSIRCSDCHNVHATSAGTMGNHSDWPTTTKPMVGHPGGINNAPALTDNTTPPEAIAADGSRLITLNDFWAREPMAAQAVDYVRSWLQTPAGGSYSGAALDAKVAEMDYNGISLEDLDKTAAPTAFKQNWAASVDIFCFRCHTEDSLRNRTHQGGGSASHKSKALACVHCHTPTVHGGKMERMLVDRSSTPEYLRSDHTPMQPHQVFRWVDYSNILPRGSQVINTSHYNKPVARIEGVSISDMQARTLNNRRGCNASTYCHSNNNDSVNVSTQRHWDGTD